MCCFCRSDSSGGDLLPVVGSDELLALRAKEDGESHAIVPVKKRSRVFDTPKSGFDASADSGDSGSGQQVKRLKKRPGKYKNRSVYACCVALLCCVVLLLLPSVSSLLSRHFKHYHSPYSSQETWHNN